VLGIWFTARHSSREFDAPMARPEDPPDVSNSDGRLALYVAIMAIWPVRYLVLRYILGKVRSSRPRRGRRLG